MKKRVLIVATVPSMIGCFNMNNIHTLIELGYTVDVACDFLDNSIWPKAKVETFRIELEHLGVKCFQINFSRSPLRLDRHILSYRETKRLIERRKYSFIHTHTPVASAIVRLAALKIGTKVIYTAHGFHFYDGASKKNWIIFYPIEKLFSRMTYVLITINKEDYLRAKFKFNAKKTIYLPGVGVDIEKFKMTKQGRTRIRTELGLSSSDFMLLSVGELNINKNHENVIKALHGIGLKIVYVIVGKGLLEEELRETAKKFDVNLKLMGFRSDVVDFYSAADAYILPSLREGLNVSLMEAMANGLPCLASRIRGNIDLIINNRGGYLFDPTSPNEIRRGILKIQKNNRLDMGCYNMTKIQGFSVRTVNKKMRSIYDLMNI